MKNLLITLAVIIVIVAAYIVYRASPQPSLVVQPTVTAQPTPVSTAADEYNPSIDPGNFVSQVTNPYYTLAPGTTFTYQSETDEGIEKIVVKVTDQTKKILSITATVIWDRVWLDDELIEETYDWYAQDKQGNVWYMGEDSMEYEDGKVTSAKGSWEAGVNGAKPGIIMKANPKVGDSYRQEYLKNEAEDMAGVVSLDEKVTTSLGVYEGCLKTRDWSQIETNLNEHKYYCPDLGGLVLEVNIATGERTELVSVEHENNIAPTAVPTTTTVPAQLIVPPTTTIPQITSFAECEAAGFPIMESYPRQCRTSDGKNFTEEIATSQESGIRGIVLLGPTCPVMRDPPDPACDDKKFATSLVVTTADQSTVVKEFSSDANGAFSVSVSSGDYAIRSAVAANVLPYCSSDGIITVIKGSYTQATIHCDTGIR